MSNPQPPSIRYVVFHMPGPNWQYGVREHVAHYLRLHEQGKLELGGPFLSVTGCGWNDGCHQGGLVGRA